MARPRNTPALNPVDTPRMSAVVRKAVNLIVTEGKTVRDAARAAGMNESALSRAMHRPGFQEWLEQQKALFCLEIDNLKAGYKAMAIQHAAYLLKNASSEAVQARMVEFFAGEAKAGPSVNVQINNNSRGYEYVKPGQQLVDITPTDTQSGGEDD